MGDNEKKASADQEKQRNEADQTKPSLATQRMRMASTPHAPGEEIKLNYISLPINEAMRTPLPSRLGDDVDTSGSSRAKDFRRMGMLPDLDAASLTRKSGILPGLNATIPRAPAAAKGGERIKKMHEELSTYLADDFNFERYRAILAREREAFSNGVALAFFKELYKQYDFVKENKANSTLVLSKVRELEQNGRNQPNFLSNDDAAAKRDREEKAKIRFQRFLSSLCMLIRCDNEGCGQILDKDLWRCLMLLEQELENHLQDSNIRAQVMREVRSVVLKYKFDFPSLYKLIQTLADTKAKHQYLTEILLEYNRQDLVDEDMSQGFGNKCQLEIAELEKRMDLESSGERQSEGLTENQDDNQEAYSWRSRILALLLLTFDRLDVPEDIQRTKVLEFFLFITGGKNKQKIKELLANPTGVKAESERSIKLLCADLHIVRDQLSRLGLSETARKAISEIEFLLEDLEEKTN